MWSQARGLAIGFLCAIEDACAEHRIPCPGGHAILDSHHRLLWDANHLRVESESAPPAAALAEAAEQHLGGERFRMIELLSERAAEPLREPLGALGYRSADRVLMILEDTPPTVEAVEVHGIARQSLEQSRLETLSETQDYDAEVNRQLMSRDAVVATVVPEQCYAVLLGGRVVSRCQVYGNGAIAQIEHVYTLEEHRRRGYAAAVVSHAARTARALGASDVFLLAAADDWHPAFYRGLGFADAGRLPRFLRLLD